MKPLLLGALATFLVALPFHSKALDILTVAVFDFDSKDEAVLGLGPKVATLINAMLSADSRIITVERAELEKILGEQELGLSGSVSADTAARVGHLTGAKVLVTGRMFKIEKETVIVAKIIGTETGRVYGELVKDTAASSISDLADALTKKISKVVHEKGDTLVAKTESHEEKIERIVKSLKQGKRPTISITIRERHFGAPVIDPAAETELALILQKAGFKIIDEKTRENPNLEITGEAFSAFGMRKGNLISCRARIELKAQEKQTGKILAVDRETSVAVDVAEQAAGKAALQKAALDLAERLLPKLLE